MSIKFQFIILKIKKKESQIFFAFSCTFLRTKHKNTNIKFDFRSTKKKKKSIYTISQYINTNTHFLRHTTTFITHQTHCLSLSQSQSQMKTTKTIANSPHFLNHQTNPSLLILNPHVSLVYQTEER